MIKLNDNSDISTKDLNTINSNIKKDANGFVNKIEHEFNMAIYKIVKHVLDIECSHKILMISGPSSSGKTTTAVKISKGLEEFGVGIKIISLDDFYRGKGIAPQLPNGKFDYEDIEALNIKQLQDCLFNLVNDGYCEKPIFDFINRRPKDKKEVIKLEKDEIAIVEGIHALHPIISSNLPNNGLIKLYVNVDNDIKQDDETILTSQTIRLIRRLVRDYRFRNTKPTRTFNMWKDVCVGEKKYILPYKNQCNISLNSFHSYEVNIIGKNLIPILEEICAENEYYEFSERIIKTINKFEFIDDEYMPKNSILREFIGD